MQKVLRINAQARTQTIKKQRGRILALRKGEDKDYWAFQARKTSEDTQLIRAERKRRREDWMTGPLAPDRDVGSTRGLIGSVSTAGLQRKQRPWHAVTVEKTFTGNEGNIMVGDRVCVMTGPSKGQIGEVVDVNKESGTVTVEDLNKFDVRIPAGPRVMHNRALQTVDMPLGLDDVRLVFRPDGSSKDVIVRAIEEGGPEYVRKPGAVTPKHTRYVAGTDQVIPWPDERDPLGERQAGDTVRMLVDEDTYVPEVISPPFPKGVADEIVPKFRHDRNLHEDTYVARKIVEDARSAWYDSRTLVTPQQQRLQLLAEERRAAEALARSQFIQETRQA